MNTPMPQISRSHHFFINEITNLHKNYFQINTTSYIAPQIFQSNSCSLPNSSQIHSSLMKVIRALEPKKTGQRHAKRQVG